MNKTPQLTQRAAWQALQKHRSAFGDTHLRDLFAADPQRGERFVAEGAGLYLDYSKNRITDETLALLVALARRMRRARPHRSDVARRQDQRHRKPQRAAHRVACRARRRVHVDGKNVVPDVHAVLDRMSAFAERVRSGEWKGYTGKRIRNVVNIGIGGSGSGSGDGVRSAAPLLRSRHAIPLRIERRRHRFRRSRARFRARRNAVHHLLENVHDAGNADQRARRARLVPRLGERRIGRQQAFRRRLDERKGSDEVRHRYRQHVRLLGLGRRPLFDGFGDRPVDDDRHRPDEFPRHARRFPRHGSSTSAPRRSNATCRRCSACSRCGTSTSSTPAPSRSCRTSNTSSASRLICSSSRWRATASTSRSTARASITKRVRSSGASPAPTASIRSISCCIRARASCRAISSASCAASIRSGSSTIC